MLVIAYILFNDLAGSIQLICKELISNSKELINVMLDLLKECTTLRMRINSQHADSEKHSD